MTVHLPDSIGPEFLQAWRKKRLRSLLIWSPALIPLAWGAIIALLYWKGGGLLHFINEYWETNALWLIYVIIPAPLAVLGSVLVAYALVRECRPIAVPYCRTCRRADHALPLICPICGEPMTEHRNYAYLSFDEDKELAVFYGLKDEAD